ncbi:MAG: DMT family transporter, partial [Gemmatimonadota bacterium]|nr:DMT family transporter [Gemmatimonadota bacterium]
MSRLRSPHVGMLLVVLFWGGNFTASKLAFPTLAPMAFTAIRFLAATALVWVLAGRMERRQPLDPGLIWPLIVLGLIGNTLYQVFFINGLARTSAINTSLILVSMPTVVTVAAGVMGLETVSGRQRLALALATAGVVAVLGARGLELSAGDWQGDAMILASVGCWAAYTLGLRKIAGRISALSVTAWTLLTGMPGLVIAGWPSLMRVEWGAVTGVAWAGLAYSTLLSLVAAYLLWSRGVQRLGAARAALYTCLTPVVATMVAILVLGERPTAAHLAGGALIIGGVLLGNARL